MCQVKRPNQVDALKRGSCVRCVLSLPNVGVVQGDRMHLNVPVPPLRLKILVLVWKHRLSAAKSIFRLAPGAKLWGSKDGSRRQYQKGKRPASNDTKDVLSVVAVFFLEDNTHGVAFIQGKYRKPRIQMNRRHQAPVRAPQSVPFIKPLLLAQPQTITARGLALIIASARCQTRGKRAVQVKRQTWCTSIHFQHGCAVRVKLYHFHA